ncbi:MAG TPA: ComEC/Rec2 family competence protein, partial [Candidatus Angelobacter sp.]|nr:ComEC/Rec2 family competence protein [Candidatus Angelobacter sp.]
TQLRLEDDWEPALGTVLVTTPDVPGSNFFGGQTVEIAGVIAPPPLPLAQGLFDYRDYLKTRGIYYELKADSTNDWQLGVSPRSTVPLTDRFMNWARSTLALGLPVEDEPLRLLWAMTLGWRTAFSGDISDPFLQAGTMHMFAIDGLRIALCSGILIALMRVLQLSRAWCGAVAIPLIWFYTAATGWESSALRASLMMTIVIGGWALKRPVDLLNSLALAAVVILVCEPRQLFEASFQLSFFVMLAIALMLPVLNDLADRWLQHDPLLPEEVLSGWQKTWHWLVHRFARYFALAFAAWVGSLPLSIKYFHLFSLISTPANLLAVPLGTGALMANLGALVTGTWLPGATVLFNHAAWGFMVAMTWVSIEAAKIPGAYFYVPDISWLTIALYYAGIILLCGGWLKSTRMKMLTATVFTLIAAIYLLRLETTRPETSLTILPLNGGHAIFAAARHHSDDLLVDCGNAESAQSTLKDFLHADGVNRLPQLILTTGEVRNSGGANVLDQISGIGKLWTSPVDFHSSRYHETIAAFEHPTARHYLAKRGDTIGDWSVLYPDADTAVSASRADDNALVLKGTVNHTRILLLSDLSRAGQDRLLSLATTNELRADIVISGLPASGEPLCDELISAIQPSVIVIADSEFPAQRRASPALRDRLARNNIHVFYTREHGAVKLVLGQHGWQNIEESRSDTGN